MNYRNPPSNLKRCCTTCVCRGWTGSKPTIYILKIPKFGNRNSIILICFTWYTNALRFSCDHQFVFVFVILKTNIIF